MSVLEVRNLTKNYGDNRGIFHFNIDVNKRDIVLLLGPNGAGKTTAFRGILGLTLVESDKIDLLSIDAKENSLKAVENIGAMFSKPAFYEYLTAINNLKMLLPYYPNIDEESIKSILKEIGLEKNMNEKVKTFSTGMKQRLDFARATIHKPALLLLDEPFSGLDIEVKANLKNRIRQMQKENNTAVIISSHMVGDFENFANKLIVIYEGKTLFAGEMDEVKKTGLSLEEFYLEKLKAIKKVEV